MLWPSSRSWSLQMRSVGFCAAPVSRPAFERIDKALLTPGSVRRRLDESLRDRIVVVRDNRELGYGPCFGIEDHSPDG
jgi:hypothetical protein